MRRIVAREHTSLLDDATAGKAVTTTETYKYDASGNTTERNLSGKPGEEYRRDVAGKAVTLYLGGMELRLDTSTADVKKQKVTATRYYSYAGLTVAMRTKAAVTWLAGGQNGTAELSINAADSKVVQRRTLPFGGGRGSTGTWPGRRDSSAARSTRSPA